MSQQKLSKVAQAYERSRPAREALRAIDAVCMEVTEDKAGIVWERWYVQTSKPTEVQQRIVYLQRLNRERER